MGVLGFVGKSGSGKDYCAGFCKKYRKIALADNIRKFIEVINPFIYSYVRINDLLEHNTWDDLKSVDFIFPFFKINESIRESIVLHVRELMQTYGEAGRAVGGNNHWLDLVIPKKCCHPDVLKTNPYLLIKDVRRINEAERIKELNGSLIRINVAYELPNIDGHWRQHVTEIEQEQIVCDFEIFNDKENNSVKEQMEIILKKVEEKDRDV